MSENPCKHVGTGAPVDASQGVTRPHSEPIPQVWTLQRIDDAHGDDLLGVYATSGAAKIASLRFDGDHLEITNWAIQK